MAKTVEIDETALLAQQGVVQLVNDILKHPDGRKLIQQATKLARPDAAIPEYDAKQEVLGVVNEVRESQAAILKRLDDDKTARDAEKQLETFSRQWDQQKDRLRAAGWMDDGIEKVEALAKDRGIADLEIAAAYFEKLNPPAEPVVPDGFGSFDIFNPPEGEGDEMKRLIESRGEDNGALSSLVNKALGEGRGSRR